MSRSVEQIVEEIKENVFRGYDSIPDGSRKLINQSELLVELAEALRRSPERPEAREIAEESFWVPFGALYNKLKTYGGLNGGDTAYKMATEIMEWMNRNHRTDFDIAIRRLERAVKHEPPQPR